MTDIGCDAARDQLALQGDGHPEGALAAHLRVCADCAAESTLVRALRAGAPTAPAGLREAIVARVTPGEGAAPRAERVAPRLDSVRRWPVGLRAGLLAAAALAVLVAGGLLLRESAPEPDAAELLAASVTDLEAPALADWPGGDGLLAGAPVLAELSEAELEALLEEMGS